MKHTYHRLYIWVEGDDDERFVSHILQSRFEKYYNRVDVVKYSALKKKKIKGEKVGYK